MSFKHLGDKGAEDIAKFISFSKTIKHVNLSKSSELMCIESNSLGKEAAEYLASAL